MADNEDNNTKVAFWLVGGVAAAAVIAVLAYATGGHGSGASKAASAASTVSASDDGLIANKTLLSQVFFALGSSEVSPDGQAAVQAAKTALSGSADGALVLSGFHDASGSAEVNAKVAKERAFAVRDALVAAGVDASRIRFERPQVTLDAGDPALARRVDISITR